MKIQKLVNFPLTISAFLLSAIGIFVIYSSSKDLAYQQLVFLALGAAALFLVSQIDLGSMLHIVKPLYFIALVLLVFVLVLGIETRGSLRWIPLGIFNIQPSEFAKPVFILFLAKFWSEHKPSWLNIFKSIFLMAPVFLLIFIQPDLGSALTIIAIWSGMLFVSGISPKKIIILFLIVLLTIPSSWYFLQNYQKQRLIGFLTPEADPLGKGYNVIQSTIAVGSGQLSGRGLGRGTQSRLQFLPEFRTDFIFAFIAEEMGFTGSMLVLGLYLFLILWCLKIAQNAYNILGLLVTTGVLSMLSFQIFVNIGMNVGLAPITGITLPLISYGGSSLISTLLSLGMVASSVKKG